MISTFDLSKLQTLLKDFYTLTQIRLTVYDDSFHELASYPEHVAPFCQIIRSTEEGRKNCQLCDRNAFQTASKRRSLYTYRCHAGLTESITPIIVSNIVIGYLFFGHVFSYPSYEEGWEEISKNCGKYSLDMNELKNACMESPVISTDFISSSSHIMQAVASYLCMERMVTLRQQELPVQIDKYIQEHFTENIEAVSIASHFGIGKTRLYEIAKESYGIGIAEYIRNLRIEKSKQLLTERPELPLAEIASLCGFPDYNYFITTFRKKVGMPPKSYQRIHT